MKLSLAIPLFTWLLLEPPASAHPMDLGSMDAQIMGYRMKVSLKLHTLAAARFAKVGRLPGEEDIPTFAGTLLAATIGQAPPTLGGAPCEWLRPSLGFADKEHQFLLLEVIAVCLQARTNLYGLNFPLPFLRGAPPAFQLLARVEGRGEPVTLLAGSRRPWLELGPQDTRSFPGFLRLGMGHIGALPEEWRTNEGAFRYPAGLDHVLFVLALVVAGGSLGGLLASASGFTVGHSLTLALSVFKVLHVHSHWVEAFIALSIAYVAGLSLLRPRASHRWIVATIFGTVHGLGFASALQELDLTRAQLLPALLGFNLGVELGQCAIILVALPLLIGLKRLSQDAYLWFNRLLAAGLLVLGLYWFLLRSIG